MADEPKLRAQILVSLTIDGAITIQATTPDLITNLGMLEAAKTALRPQQKSPSAIISAKSIDPMLKQPPR